jgi:hypothetical protein
VLECNNNKLKYLTLNKKLYDSEGIENFEIDKHFDSIKHNYLCKILI